MSNLPLVSIIIPAYNAESYIDDAIRSVLDQTYPNLEIIVVDDGSSDSTQARVAAYAPRVHCVRRAQRSGTPSVPRNIGMHHSTGEYVAFLDADDMFPPGRIERQTKFLASHPDVELAFTDYRNFSESGPADRSHFQRCSLLRTILDDRPSLVLTSGEATALLAKENFGITGSLMMRRTLLQIEAGFEPILKASEDFHFYYRLAQHGAVGVINEVGMLRRLHPHSITASPLPILLLEGIRTRTLLRDTEGDPAIREDFNRYIAKCHAQLARYHADHGDYLQALREEGQALSAHASVPRVWRFCRGIARTIGIATGAHRPEPGNNRSQTQAHTPDGA